jgi:lysophospholipase L1-like esterase
MLTRQHHKTTRRQFVGGALAVIGGLPIIDALGAFTGGLDTANAATSTSTQRLLMVGDSLTVGSLPYQAAAFIDNGWTDMAVNAHGSRGIKTKVSADPYTGLTAVDALRAAHGDADLWVVALGTNDAGQYPASQYPDLIASMLNRIGADHLTMWVNTYMPTRARLQGSWNSALNEVAAQRPDELVVFDWAAYAAGHAGWLGADSIHYTSVGYKSRSSAVAAASTETSQQVSGSQRTTDNPPVVTTVSTPAGFQPVPPVRILDTRSRWRRRTRRVRSDRMVQHSRTVTPAVAEPEGQADGT